MGVCMFLGPLSLLCPHTHCGQCRLFHGRHKWSVKAAKSEAHDSQTTGMAVISGGVAP